MNFATHPHRLDPLTFPLHGSRLIEASAGTGKTWTIAALYLRLVLGHGTAADGADGGKTEQQASAFGRPLLPAEILVMTFTRAATRELSERIRARLAEAARCFRGESSPPAGDTLLSALLADYPDESARRQAAWRLSMAADAMDDAAVFTIDAWCQRMLREHAFDSHNPFDEELVADQDSLLRDAVQDYWRQHVYPLAGEQLAVVLRLWPDVSALHTEMRKFSGAGIAPPASEESLHDCVERAARPLRELSCGWAERARAMQGWIEAELAANGKSWNGNKLQARYYTSWLRALETWAKDPLRGPLALTDSARSRLTPAGMAEARRAGATAPKLPDHFAAFESLLSALDAVPNPQSVLRLHAAAAVGHRLALLKQQARRFDFADMLERLDAALGGPHGERLRARILARYPVALIDEFQDTSPRQYHLFDALYRCADNDPDTGLLLIGDPKQSIYGFRGADIYSYLQARNATRGRHYMLDTNYRSSAALVRAVNHCFAQAEARTDAAPDGAFLFRRGSDNQLPFEAVQARGRDEHFQNADGEVPAIQILHDLELRHGDQIARRFAAHCAERIVGWLNDDEAGFRAGDGRFTRLRPADVAVLVRTGTEAATVRAELRRRGVASVYLSEKDSVFASAEAADLLRWLRAVAAPLDARLLRAALATRTIGLPIAELARIASDDLAFDVRSDELRQLHRAWRELGVLTMLRRTLHRFDLPARWLSQPDGERSLTNFLHLAELLQQASAELDGEQALIRWLAMQIDDPAERGDDQVVRLESDADLVKVVTVHKSKGLEYPVVCLPFACSLREVVRKDRSFLQLPDAAGTRELKLDFDDEDLHRADIERLREDLRLFYVALTRARHAVWMGFAARQIGRSQSCRNHLSGAGCLLGGPTPREAAAWLPVLEALAAGAGGSIRLEAAADTAGFTRLREHDQLPPLRDLPRYDADFERHWSLGSFSALVRDIDANAFTTLAGAPAAPPAGIAAAEAVTEPLAAAHVHRPAADEGEDEAAPLAAPLSPALAPWHRFPRGAFIGDFLHDLLEWLAGDAFALANDEAQQAALRRRCERAGHGERADEVLHWMTQVVASPLPSLGVALQDLRSRMAEMEFWMPSSRLRASAVDALCQRHLLDGQPRPPLPQRELHGLLMGFADLVFEHEGRYWVLDYKSNSLGSGPAAYDHAGLRAAMAQHRYDVQAAIYLLALHRLLRHRLGTHYQPERQLGGALYFFLRGIDGPTQGEYAIAATPAVLALLDDLDQLLSDEAAPA